MENDLISKKELLDFTGISYGQLYRWKRKGLIPEEWFIKRAAFTGQETFFPREKILGRIEKIQQMKENIPLDAIAGVFSPDTAQRRLSAAELARRSIASPAVTELYAQFCGGRTDDSFDFADMAEILLLRQLLDTGNVSRDEALETLAMAHDALPAYREGAAMVCAVRKLGVFACFAVSLPCELRPEKGLKTLALVKIPALREELKQKLIEA